MEFPLPNPYLFMIRGNDLIADLIGSGKEFGFLTAAISVFL